jgi:hypothetical protein
MTSPAAFPRIAAIAGLTLFLFAAGCSEKFDLNDLGATRPSTSFGDTSYVLQQPIWTGFNEPMDVHVGYEPFIYVADAGSNRIVMLDLAGAVVGASGYIKRPVAIAQDHRLNLLVCAEFDTTINGQAATFGAIYKIDLYAARHAIAQAAIRRVYFDPLNTHRRFTGIATLADNSYYAARTGASNASIIDPDDAVMLFTPDDSVTQRVYWPTLPVDGSGLATLTKPTAIATFPKKTTDFLFTQQGEQALFRAQWITQRTTGDVTQWESYFTPARDGAVDFLRVRLFSRPEDITVDAAGNVFVIDAGLDSLFRFNNSGFITQAFGGPAAFNRPSGVASFDKTLYIADTGNNRILRYVLSTDLK